jgi:lysophospholipase L1-like esterase
MCAIGSALRMWALCAAVTCSTLTAGLIGFASPAAAAGTATQAAPMRYYLALGDSLSTGGGASKGEGYVNDVFTAAAPHVPGLTLKDLGCGGDSTTRMIHGGLCHNYTTGNQLGDAEAFLRANKGHVAFVTIDVGGDDIVGCGLSGTINHTCVSRALTNIETNMPVILSGLRAAAGDVPIVGMTYYDPLLAFYLKGATGMETARESVGITQVLNYLLRTFYREYHVKVANGQKAFATADWQMTGSYNGRVLPQNVANICNWTHMCETNPNIHANDTGHALLATKFEARLRSFLKR